MARSSTSFTSETAPKGNRGAKHKKTLLKEAIGVKNWEQLKEYVEGKGLEKCIEELQKQKGNRFVYAYLTLTEFVKPKLARTIHAGDKDNPVQGEFKVIIVNTPVPIAESEDEIK